MKGKKQKTKVANRGELSLQKTGSRHNYVIKEILLMGNIKDQDGEGRQVTRGENRKDTESGQGSSGAIAAIYSRDASTPTRRRSLSQDSDAKGWKKKHHRNSRHAEKGKLITGAGERTKEGGIKTRQRFGNASTKS